MPLQKSYDISFDRVLGNLCVKIMSFIIFGNFRFREEWGRGGAFPY